MYYVYILHCSDGSIYTGYAIDIKRRLQEHREGKGSKYVRSRLPVKLIYIERFRSKSRAMKREIEIKSLDREEKIKMLKLDL